jgi:hypothetical protein
MIPMNFGKINHIILLGGSRCTLELAIHIKEHTKFKLNLFTASRQLDDVIYADGRTFEQCLIECKLNYFVSENINECDEFFTCITDKSLGVGLGEAWSFEEKIISKFDGRLVDLMGIRLPQYRGGAHYTWQILRGSKMGACNIQVVNEQMIQGVFDSGEILKSKEYLFPAQSRIPDDYFSFATLQEINFVSEFLEEVSQGVTFQKFTLQENFSMYFPRLSTLKNAFIDWNWDSVDIESFICAFDDPYSGSSTSINGELVRVKKARYESNDGNFHPFQSGLIYKIYNQNIYVATRQGTIIISQVNNEFDLSIINNLSIGDRFITPQEWIHRGLSYKIEY